MSERRKHRQKLWLLVMEENGQPAHWPWLLFSSKAKAKKASTNPGDVPVQIEVTWQWKNRR